MDIPTAIFIIAGLGLMLIPLHIVSSLLISSTDLSCPSYYSLSVPFFGGILLAIGLLSYHKQNLHMIFMKACNDIDQTGLGRGVGDMLSNIFSSPTSVTPIPLSNI